MDLRRAVERILLGEELSSIAASVHEEELTRRGLVPETAEPSTGATEVADYMRRLCRELGDRHAGDHRIAVALLEWTRSCRDYEAFDALLSGFEFEGRERVLRIARAMFPRAMTAHWESA
jgi:hypothetical protein